MRGAANAGSLGQRWQPGPTLAVWADDGSLGQRWQSGPTMVVRTNDGSPGQRWQSGPTMAFRTNEGSPGQRWQSGPMMAVRANSGSPGQRWQLPHNRNPDNWPQLLYKSFRKTVTNREVFWWGLERCLVCPIHAKFPTNAAATHPTLKSLTIGTRMQN
jgi:hypothetical protein